MKSRNKVLLVFLSLCFSGDVVVLQGEIMNSIHWDSRFISNMKVFLASARPLRFRLEAFHFFTLSLGSIVAKRASDHSSTGMRCIQSEV